MKMLPAHTNSTAMVRYDGPTPPTHTARYQVKRRYNGGHDWDVIGAMDVNVGSDRDMRRLRLLDARLNYKFIGTEVARVMLPIEKQKQPRQLSDLQRFRRKMGMVLRAYEQEKQEILDLHHGIFVDDELARLERDLEEAWAKAEEIYGCTRDEYNTNGTPAQP